MAKRDVLIDLFWNYSLATSSSGPVNISPSLFC
jgi:hypothetical protein